MTTAAAAAASLQSCLTFPSPGDLPTPGIEPGSHAFQADILPSEPPGKPTLREGGLKEGGLWKGSDVLSPGFR